MLSISSQPPLIISFRRAEVTAFWIVTTVVLSAGLGVASFALGARAPWAWGAAGICVVLPGLFWPLWFEIGVKVWNKGASLSAAAIRAYLLKVSYYVLFSAVALGGSRLDLERSGVELSRWIPRHRPAVDDGGTHAAGENWTHALLAAARDPGKTWMICLLPIVMLLLLLRDEQQERAPSSSTYTLY